MCLPWRGPHLAILLGGFSAPTSGACDWGTKWMQGHGAGLVWNSLRSTFKPSKQKDTVSDEATCAAMRFEAHVRYREKAIHRYLGS